jgi:hypothetical protein
MKPKTTPREQAWRKLVAEHEQSGLSVRAFCQQREIREPSFYRWRRRLLADQPVSFALVGRGEPATMGFAPAVELALATGERLRIAAGADEATLRVVLSVLRERE